MQKWRLFTDGEVRTYDPKPPKAIVKIFWCIASDTVTPEPKLNITYYVFKQPEMSYLNLRSIIAENRFSEDRDFCCQVSTVPIA